METIGGGRWGVNGDFRHPLASIFIWHNLHQAIIPGPIQAFHPPHPAVWALEGNSKPTVLDPLPKRMIA